MLEHMPLQEMLNLCDPETLLEAIKTRNKTELQEFRIYIHGAGSYNYELFKRDCSRKEKQLLDDNLNNLEGNKYMVSHP